MKVKWLSYAVTAVFALLLIALFKMQVVDGRFYLDKAEKNRIRPVILEAPRGVILDRNGRELVGNRLSFDCFLLPQRSGGDPPLEHLADLLRQPIEKLHSRYKAGHTGPFTPVLVAPDIGHDAAVKVEEDSDRLPGVFIKTRPIREYTLGPDAAHVIGFVGAINPEEFGRWRDLDFRRTDIIGRDGIERFYDAYLRGRHGASQFEVDSRGRLLRVLNIQEQEQGLELQTTLDTELQKTVGEALRPFPGAVVVMELDRGGILALASAPGFDPNWFVMGNKPNEEISKAIRDSGRRFFNRAVSGEYPPGSTFKIITALNGLAAGKVNSATSFFCPGSFTIGNRAFKCWNHSGHGSQNLVAALEHSCDVYFYNLGLRVGAQAIDHLAREFGLGEKTRVDLPQEKSGVVPGPEWKRRVMNQPWYAGDTLNFVIGQGYLLTTPLQMVRVTAVAATGGRLFRPFVVDKIGGVDVSPTAEGRVHIRPEDLAVVRRGMERVVQSDQGTGQRARVPGLVILGKTGTAQAPRGEDHAWFVGYAPQDRPRAAVAVMLEHGGHGGMNAAEIAGKIFSRMKELGYFKTGDAR
jgi:penicillin-binding protein 2